jgi:hypothetical protein
MNEIREDITKAFETSGGSEAPSEPQAGPSIEDVGTDEVTTPGELPTEAAPTTTGGRDEKTGRFAKPGPAPAPVKPAATATAVPAAPPSADATPPATEAPKPATPTVKAPQSWKPEVREKWAALPPEVQAEVDRREKEVGVALKESGEARKSWQAFREVVGPYEGLIRAAGSEPLKAVGSLLQTEAVLRTALPAQKAQVVANIIKQYGVDVTALDEALTGKVPAIPTHGAAPALDPEALLQQAEQRVFQRLQTQRQQSIEAKAQADTEAFVNSGEAEFLEDVRGLMANLLDSAGRSGIKLTLKDAYDRACLLSPEVSKVLEQRKAAQAATVTQAATQRARTAASSVRSQPAAPPAAAESDDLRSLLQRNWSKASGR